MPENTGARGGPIESLRPAAGAVLDLCPIECPTAAPFRDASNQLLPACEADPGKRRSPQEAGESAKGRPLELFAPDQWWATWKLTQVASPRQPARTAQERMTPAELFVLAADTRRRDLSAAGLRATPTPSLTTQPPIPMKVAGRWASRSSPTPASATGCGRAWATGRGAGSEAGRLPEDLHSVMPQLGIPAHQRQTFDLTLRHEQPVERVPVYVRQSEQVQHVRSPDGQHLDRVS